MIAHEYLLNKLSQQQLNDKPQLDPLKNVRMLSYHWASDFMRRNHLSLRRVTTNHMLESNEDIAAQFRINEYNEIISQRLNRLNSLYNFDETGVNYDAPAKYTVNEKGAKSVAVGTSGHERMRSTVLLTVGAKGKKFPPLIIHHHTLPTLNKKKTNIKSIENARARHRRVTRSWSRITVDGKPKIVRSYIEPRIQQLGCIQA